MATFFRSKDDACSLWLKTIACRLFLGQMPILKSKAFGDQVFTDIEHLLEIRGVVRLVTSKCAGELGRTK